MSHFCYEEKAKRASFGFVPVDGPEECRDFITDQHLLNGRQGIPEFIRRHSLSKIVKQYDLIAQACQSRNIVLESRGLFDTPMRLAAEKSRLTLRWIFGKPSQATTWEPGSIAEVMLRLLRAPEVAESCRALAGRLQNTNGAAAACEIIAQPVHI